MFDPITRLDAEAGPGRSPAALARAALLPGRLSRVRYRIGDLAPTRRELRRPVEYARATVLYSRLSRGGYTKLSARRGRTLFQLARMLDRFGIGGALVDCGAWNGGSTALMAAASPHRIVWAFDSFEGLPAPSNADGVVGDWFGRCHGDEETLREAVARAGRGVRLEVRRGWFEDTFLRARTEVGPVALLHCDADWYDSVLLTLRTFYPLLVPGGVVVVDDYGHWLGAQRATDEFRDALADAAPLQRIDYTGRWWRKRTPEEPARGEHRNEKCR